MFWNKRDWVGREGVRRMGERRVERRVWWTVLECDMNVSWGEGGGREGDVLSERTTPIIEIGYFARIGWRRT